MTNCLFSSPIIQNSSEFCSHMSTLAPFRLISPKTTLPLHLKTSSPSALISSKSPRFLSISIERLPTKIFSSSSSVESAPSQSVEDLPAKLKDIVKLFQSVEDSKAKYQQLLFYGRTLAPLEAKFKTKENKVQGCVSQVWVRAYLDSDKKVHFQADSDSSLTKGLAALLVQGFSGQPVSEIVNVSPNFITMLGLQQSLTPSRNNGFLNMMKLMQIKALQLYKEAEESGGVVNHGDMDVGSEGESSNSSDDGDGKSIEETEVIRDDLGSGSSETVDTKSNSGAGLGSRGERIKEVLVKELSPIELVVEDISHQHAGHAGVGRNAVETHFNVKIVSEAFEGKSLVKRHRLVYDLLQNELQTGLHALSIVAKKPSEVNGG